MVDRGKIKTDLRRCFAAVDCQHAGIIERADTEDSIDDGDFDTGAENETGYLKGALAKIEIGRRFAVVIGHGRVLVGNIAQAPVVRAANRRTVAADPEVVEGETKAAGAVGKQREIGVRKVVIVV